MKFLSHSRGRYETWLSKPNGMRFRGHLMPLTDNVATTTTYLEPRHVLHTRPNEPVTIREVIFDDAGGVFLVAEHDVRNGLRKVFRLFHLTQQMSWKRPEVEVEPITGMERNIRDVEIGPIWVSTEIYGREAVDRGLHIGMDRERVITGADIRINDKINGMMVRRIATVYGVTVAEIQ